MQTALHANAEVVRRGYHGFITPDMNRLTRSFHEQSSWHTPGKGAIAGSHKGREAVFGQFGRYLQESGGTFKAELRHVHADEHGRVIATHQNTGQRKSACAGGWCCKGPRTEPHPRRPSRIPAATTRLLTRGRFFERSSPSGT